MQKIFLLLLLMAGAAIAPAQAQQQQSLKDLLYGGKLKMDSNTVVRKTDDLKAKIDSGQKKPAVAPEKETAGAPADLKKKTEQRIDSSIAAHSAADSVAATVVTAAENAVVSQAEAELTEASAAVPAKSNTRLWKEYTDSLVATLKPDIDRAGRVKKGTYHVLVSYEIETDGRVSVTNVGVTPSNDLLQAQVRQYLDGTALELAPTLDSAGKPRKTRRSGSFTITKD